MNALDKFVDELRAVGPVGSLELERLEDCLRVLRADDSDAAVADYDRMNAAARARLPLLERLQAMMRTMTTGR